MKVEEPITHLEADQPASHLMAYQHVWRLIRYQPALYTVNGTLWTLIHVAPLVPGLIAQAFFNALPQAKGLNGELWELILLLLMAALARSILIFMGGWVDTLHRFSMSALLRRNLLERILERPGARAVPGSPGEAISRFRDDGEQAEDAISWTLDLIGEGLFALIAVIILLRINVPITLLVFLPLAGVVALAQALSKRLERYRRASRKATGQVTSAIGEIFNTVQGIQVAAAEPHVLAHFQRLNERRRAAMLKDRVLEQLLNSTIGNTVGIGTGLILVLAATMMRGSQPELGDLALFIYYLAFVADFTQSCGMTLAHYAQTKVAFQRMEMLLQGAPARRLTEARPLHLSGPVPETRRAERSAQDRLETLEVNDLSYHHPESGRGIEKISLRLQRGTLTVITGRIAAGKTTLLQTMLGLLPKESGEIRWNGRVVDDPASFFTPPRSAYTAQIPRLFSATLRENILLGLPEEPARTERAIHTAVMERDLEELENGLDTFIGTRGVKLSGGQAQRSAAARMFVREPELLVFDDLSSALDVETEHILWERIFHQGRQTCLVVSHRRAVLQRADQIILLKEGKVEEIDRLEQLLQRSEEMRHLWQEIQLEE